MLHPRPAVQRCLSHSGATAVICAPVLARDLAELGRNPLRKPVQHWSVDPTEAIYLQKIGKSYSAKKVNLLLYVDGRNVMPDDVVQAGLESLVGRLGKGPFDRLWLMNATACGEIEAP